MVSKSRVFCTVSRELYDEGKKKGICFSEVLERGLSLELSVDVPKAERRRTKHERAAEILRKSGAQTYTVAQRALMSELDVSQTVAAKELSDLRALGVLNWSGGSLSWP